MADRIGWPETATAAACDECDWRFVLPEALLWGTCPYCHTGELRPLTPGEQAQIESQFENHPPEHIVPSKLTDRQVTEALANFAESYIFMPADLKLSSLESRASLLLVPVWLVDAEVEARWQAEVGLYYAVTSHEAELEHGTWTAEAVVEKRIRWEPRVGTLARAYNNCAADAVDGADRLSRQLAVAADEPGLPIRDRDFQGAIVLLPNRSQMDAWPDTEPHLHKLAAQECRYAAAGDDIRQFEWQWRPTNQSWTLRLIPMMTTYYHDDKGRRHSVTLDAMTGQITGVRRASVRKAFVATAIFLAAALCLLLLYRWLKPPPDSAAIVLWAVLASAAVLLSVLPLIYVAQFNQGSGNS